MSTVGDLGASGLAVQQLCKLVAPNSIPPERVFSILNYTFDDDQDRALADYIELSLHAASKFNSTSAPARKVYLPHSCLCHLLLVPAPLAPLPAV